MGTVNVPTQLLHTGILNESLLQINWSDYSDTVSSIHHYLEKTDGELTGWLNFPLENNDDMLNSIINISNEIKMLADVLVVVGIGGSFLGARAIQDALTPYFGSSSKWNSSHICRPQYEWSIYSAIVN